MEVLMAERADLVFHNNVIGGTAIKRLISRLIDHFGMAYTSHILDQVKTLGFHQATATSISLGIDDLLTIPSKGWLVQDAEQQSSILEKHNHYGNVHAVEKLRQSIEIWYATSEYLRQQMNSNFRMTDPFNPVHIMSFSGARGNASQVHQLVGMRGLMSDPQGQMIDLPIQSNLREGLSLTEYIISCYGARKGVVDTAVRTSDAGYLTRRLVEVVQHIVVRRTDCGSRCIVVRNQDIGIGLINRFITFQTQPIFIRTPFTCRNTSWICRLCYGRSPIHGDLVELGEAVGIIAGQSIGEPGTQLTLRTFHTGGVFTGDFYVTIESDDIIHNVIIPPKSFLLVQNNQYVKSEQVIAEIRAGTSTLNLKERVQKHIYSDSEGEMHWSTDVYHTSQFIYSNVHILPKTSHLWILSGKSCRSNTIHFLLRKDQDQVTMDSLSNGKTNISNLLERNDQVKHKFNTFGTKEKWISDSSILNQIICTDHSDLMYPAILNDTFYFLAKRRRNRFLIPFPFQSIQERKNELMSPSGVSIEIPINGIFHENSIFAYFNDPQYIRQSSGITKYTTIGIHSIFQKEDFTKMKNGPHLKLKSGQVITVQMDSVIIRLANPYLATPEATIHGHYGEILSQGDILVTFIYEKSRSGDITQGLPKVEQILEIRSIDSISMNLEKRIDAWNECITKILGMPWGFLIGAELTIAQSRISLVNKIQKVYRSQGVHIHNRHIEIIVRQITSKVLVSEDGMSNVFLPGELIGLLRAERMGRALEEPICYRALLLGITKTSLNTQSFISEASFQETARVLAKAALRGRIDWLKGLKENVVLGGMIPVGTGFKRIMHQMMEAGVHFGHEPRNWNPRMAPFISGKRKGIHITNLTKTARFLSEACDLAFDAASTGKQFLIVGTKKKAADSVTRAAIRARCHYVNKKWLRGMLTNWYTTETRLREFRDLRTEQKTGKLNSLPKRDATMLKRQLSHLERYLGGIKYMTRLPDIVIILDQQEEYTALQECITLGIPTISLIDTNSDPDLADISIPANDDAIASIGLILNKLVFAIFVRNPQTIPTSGQNFFEYVLEFIRDVSKTQIGEEYGPWVPFIGTLFLFIFVSNWSGALLPWKIIKLPHGELAAPTNDINTTVALALLTSVAYFYAGISKKGLAYFGKYIQPTPILLPINILEDFTKPLSLSFRLFGNILADELVVVVLVSLVPLVVPIPVMFLGLFTSGIQALIFATLAAAYIGESMEGHH
ncbi:hypothetical protein RYX36_015748 [Vicia faba]